MSRVLVTGVNGFVGHHVAEQLRERGEEVIGVGNQSELQDNLGAIVDEYIGCDLTNPKEVAKIALSGVDAIINLAGFASVGDSRGKGEIYNSVNVGVHAVLYQECINQGVKPRIIAISTGAVYDSSQPLPITEESSLVEDDKTNEYVVSKKKTEEAVTKFTELGLRCIIARPFNHTGTGQMPGFLLPDLYDQIIASQASGEPLMVGNLSTKRDFTDVRDVAKAYIDLALCDEDKLRHNVYNICSGRSVAGQTILDILARTIGISDLATEIDKSKIRPNDVMDIYGSSDKLHADTGWQPLIPIEQTIEDFVKNKKSI